MVMKYNDPADQLLVFFPDETTQKVGIKTLKTYCERMQAEKIHNAVIVVASGMTPSARSTIHEMKPKYQIEMFMEQELLINITEHELVPIRLFENFYFPNFFRIFFQFSNGRPHASSPDRRRKTRTSSSLQNH